MMREKLVMAGFCLILTVGSLAVLVWTLISGMSWTRDTLLLVSTCLLVALIFGVNLFLLLRETDFCGLRKRH